MRNPSNESLVRATDYHFGPVHLAVWVAAIFGLASVPGLQATVLDNFTGPKTGWTDTLNNGSIVQSGGEFIVSTAPTLAGGSLTYSKKTSAQFTNANGITLEFRVDVDLVTPSGNTNPPAVGVPPEQMRLWGRQVAESVLPGVLALPASRSSWARPRATC